MSLLYRQRNALRLRRFGTAEMKWIFPTFLLLLSPISPVVGAVGAVILWLMAYNAYLNWKWGES